MNDPETENENRENTGNFILNNKNVNENSDYGYYGDHNDCNIHSDHSDSFEENLFNVNKKYIANVATKEQTYKEYKFKNNEYANSYVGNSVNYEQNKLNGNFEKWERYNFNTPCGYNYGKGEKDVEADQNKNDDKQEDGKYGGDGNDDDGIDEQENDKDDNEDVLKYYAVVKNDKMNDENLQNQIDSLLNFNKKSETYEEREKNLSLGSLYNEEIDSTLLYDEMKEEDLYFSLFLEDLNKLKKVPISEYGDYTCKKFENKKIEENNNHVNNFDLNNTIIYKQNIVHSINSRNVLFSEKRLLDINNVNLNNILYFYFCSNQENVLNMEKKNNHVYSYDSYIFDTDDHLNDYSSNANLDSETNSSSSISDEELLLLKHNNADEEEDAEEGGDYANEDEIYFSRRKGKKKKKKKNGNNKGNIRGNGRRNGRRSGQRSGQRNGQRNEGGNMRENMGENMGIDEGQPWEQDMERKKRVKRYKNNEKRLASVEPTKMNKEVESLMNKANNLYISKNFEECIVILETVIKLSPCYHDPFHLLGLIYELEFKNLKKAINYYTIAAHLSRNDFLSWYNIIDLCKIEKQYNTVLYCLYRVLKLYKRKREKWKRINGDNCCNSNSSDGNDMRFFPNEGERVSDGMEGTEEDACCDGIEGQKEYVKRYMYEEDIKENNKKRYSTNNNRERINTRWSSSTNELDNFMKHLYFNLAFTYILLEDYKNALKNLLVLKNKSNTTNIIVDMYICLCLIILRSPTECYHFLKSMYLQIMREKGKNMKSNEDGENGPYLLTVSNGSNWKYDWKSSWKEGMHFPSVSNQPNVHFTYTEKTVISLLMQTQILNSKYDECIFVFKKLEKRSDDILHIDIFIQYIKAVIITGYNVHFSYLLKAPFLRFIFSNDYSFYEDVIFNIAESYYGRCMYEGGIHFYRCIYKRGKSSVLNGKKGNYYRNPDAGVGGDGTFRQATNSHSGSGKEWDKLQRNTAHELVNVMSGKNSEEAFHNSISSNIGNISLSMPLHLPAPVPTNDVIIKFENEVNFVNVVYKLVKCYYFLENYSKAEKIILKILNNENLSKTNMEIDIKMLYIDILYKLEKYNKSINVLLSIKEKRLRSICSMPKPLSNKEREILLLKLLNQKNKLLLYTCHNSYIVHIFYIFQKKKYIYYKYDNYISKSNINSIIRIKENICFCYFCVKYNLFILNYLYLYNILSLMNSKKEVQKENVQRIRTLFKYREYLLFLACSFNIFKKRKKQQDMNIIYGHVQLVQMQLFYKGILIEDLSHTLFQWGDTDGRSRGCSKRGINGNRISSAGCSSSVNCGSNSYSPCEDLLNHDNCNGYNLCCGPDDDARESACGTKGNSGNYKNEEVRIRKEFYRNLSKFKCDIEAEILNSKIVMKFYKFSYNLFYFLYEVENDFNRIHTYMEKEILNYKKGIGGADGSRIGNVNGRDRGKGRSRYSRDAANGTDDNCLFVNAGYNPYPYGENNRTDNPSKLNYTNSKNINNTGNSRNLDRLNRAVNAEDSRVSKKYYNGDDICSSGDKNGDNRGDNRGDNSGDNSGDNGGDNRGDNKGEKRIRKFSFLLTRKRLNFFSFESYLGLYYSLLFFEESFFLVSMMNLYEDAIHILSLYLKNRRSNKLKFINYLRTIKKEFKDYRNDGRSSGNVDKLSRLKCYYFNNTITNCIKEEMRKEYTNFIKTSKYIDCKYYIFRINLMLNKLYISSGNFEKQVRCLNDMYIFNKKEKDEYKILKYYSDIVLTGNFCQDFLTSISKSKNKNILIIFRLFLVRTIQYKNTNPFLVYLIGNICNLSCMIVNAVHEYTRAYTFLLKNRKINALKLRAREDEFMLDKIEKIESWEKLEVAQEKGDANDYDNGGDNDYDNDGDNDYDNDGDNDYDNDYDNGGDNNDNDNNNDNDDEWHNSFEGSHSKEVGHSHLENFNYNCVEQRDERDERDERANGENDPDEENFLFTKLKLWTEKRRKNEIINNFENIADNMNFLFSLTTSYFNYTSGYRVVNRECVIMTSFCLLNEYISKRYEQKIWRKKKKYKKFSLFFKIYKYIYLAEILYNLGRALHHLSYYNECMKLYLAVIDLIKKADKEIQMVININHLNINEKFIYNYVINMKKCMCYTCLNYPILNYNKKSIYYKKLINYYHNLNTKYSNFYLLFFDKKHLLFSASYNLSVIFRKLNRYEQAKYVLKNIIWD
ncbi:hypothetical protein, conserved [Plasmodium malariae]|uniref:Tetratricopeptide repeat protein n=1 Tax=Plasmodium malariae TaxID=5858 RepID=A0A1A8W3M4_PLAMA|nr:hypothetical protein, conserved [Plasmodium malariae]